MPTAMATSVRETFISLLSRACCKKQAETKLRKYAMDLNARVRANVDSR